MKKINRKMMGLLLSGALFTNMAYAADEAFNASIRILAALKITEQSALKFPDTEAASVAKTVTVANTNSGAATFNITGEGNSTVTASIVESGVTMSNNGTDITVGSFTFGGKLGSNGVGTLDSTGKLNGAAVGATASIPANPSAGNYSGTLTFRVVYN